MYGNAVAAQPKAWHPIEDGFLRAMEAFDQNVATGFADLEECRQVLAAEFGTGAITADEWHVAREVVTSQIDAAEARHRPPGG